MTQLVRLPDRLFARLQAHAVPFVDTPASVIERIVDFYEEGTPPDERRGKAGTGEGAVGVSAGSPLAVPPERAARERGASVVIGDQVIDAVSVRELYEEALKLLIGNGYTNRLRGLVPFRTSAERYLIADRPVHPNGREFVVPVQYGGYYMEAHKDYRNGMNHLRKLVERCGLRFNDRV